MEDEVIDSTVEEVAQPEVTEQSAEKSMDDTIRETLERIQNRDDGETSEQRDQRLRDNKGRFAAKQEEVTEDPVQDTAETTQEAPQGVPPELQRLGLRKEEAEALQANPVALNAFMRRSEEMHKGLEQYRTKAQFGDAFEQAAAPYSQVFEQFGIHPADAFQRLLSAEHALRNGTPEQKQQMFLKMAQDYGINIGQVQEQIQNRPYVDPQVQTLQTQLQQMQSWIQQQNQAREWEQRQSLNSEIEKFSRDPANTYFEQVRETMAGLLQAGIAKDLKDAYEQAIYANPQIRSEVIAKQQSDALDKAKREAAQKATAAKHAASVNLTRRGIAPPARPVGSMEDTIRETALRLGILN